MTIGIVGAGASGLMAAITAAKLGAKVTLIEKKDRIGKKILSTGNGKCNFTNKDMKNTDYFGQKENVFDDYIGQFDEKDAIAFFEEAGMLVKEKNGYCYPRSEQASTVLDILRIKIKELKIDVLLESYPVSIKQKKNNFEIVLNSGEKLFFQKVIITSGSFAGEKNRDDFTGYTYAKSMGHSLVPVVPSLVQVMAKGKEFKTIAGVRCDAKIDLYVDKKFTVSEIGELQLTDYGISGIPVFQLSRYVSYGCYGKRAMRAKIDFLPEYSLEQWMEITKKKWVLFNKNANAEEYLQGFLNKKLNFMFMKLHQISPEALLKTLSFAKMESLLRNMKCWEIEIIGTKPFENAQVCAGGVSMEEITLQMESKIVPGLYFAGELLDVDGRCGGYNLQWAWTSGYLAGKNAALS